MDLPKDEIVFPITMVGLECPISSFPIPLIEKLAPIPCIAIEIPALVIADQS